MDNITSETKLLVEKVILKAKNSSDKTYNFENFRNDFGDENSRLDRLVFATIIRMEYAQRTTYGNSRIQLTIKGEKFKSFKHEERKNWFKNLPSENWLLADATKTIVTLLIGASIGWFGKTLSDKLQDKRQSTQQVHQSTNDSISYKKNK